MDARQNIAMVTVDIFASMMLAAIWRVHKDAIKRDIRQLSSFLARH